MMYVKGDKDIMDKLSKLKKLFAIGLLVTVGAGISMGCSEPPMYYCSCDEHGQGTLYEESEDEKTIRPGQEQEKDKDNDIIIRP